MMIINEKYKKILYTMCCMIIPFIICFIIASLPTFEMRISTSGVNFTFHALRIKGVWWSLENGVFPHHINDLANNFMGDADPIGYPYLFLYIPAFLLKFLPYTYCYNIYVMLVNIASFMIMYISSYSIFKNKRVAIISSIAYTLYYYRLYDIYDLCRLGEYTGLIFYPLAVAGIYNIFFDDKKKWYFLTIGICGALGAHIITFFYLVAMVLVVSLISFIVSICTIKDKSVIWYFLKATILSVLLSIWYIVPFLQYFLEKSLNFSNMGDSTLTECLIDFMLLGKMSGYGYGVGDDVIASFDIHKVPANMSFGDYASLISMIVFIIIIVISIVVSKKDKDTKKVGTDIYDKKNVYLIIAIVCLFIYIYYYLASRAIFWFQNNGPTIIQEFYGKQQYSFRELGRGGVFLCLSTGYIYVRFFDIIADMTHIKVIKVIPIYVVLCIMCLSVCEYIGAKLYERKQQDIISDAALSDYQFVMNDGSDKSVDEKNVEYITIDNDVKLSDKNLDITNYKRGYLSIVLDYKRPYDGDDCVIVLPKNAYTGYKCRIDGVEVPYKRVNGLPYIKLVGDSGHLTFRFENSISWNIAFFISIFTILVLLIREIRIEIINIIKYIKDIKRGKAYE